MIQLTHKTQMITINHKCIAVTLGLLTMKLFFKNPILLYGIIVLCKQMTPTDQWEF